MKVGMTMAVTILMRMMYEVRLVVSPPNLPAMTVAAVAVGHIIHNMAPSMITLPVISGKKAIHKVRSAKLPD
jgi:putative Ca2+/H+ antiporter (TMEM165/GDT1 family)